MGKKTDRPREQYLLLKPRAVSVLQEIDSCVERTVVHSLSVETSSKTTMRLWARKIPFEGVTMPDMRHKRAVRRKSGLSVIIERRIYF